MAKKDKLSCCGSSMPATGYKVEALISVDDRGQMVLPKEIREKACIQAGDKLALVSWEKDGNICCLSLIKVEILTGMVKDLLGPLMEEMRNKP